MSRLSLVLLLAALLGMSGCGYTLAGRGGLIGGRTVGVSMFANRSYQPGIEGQLRLALVRELASRGAHAETGSNGLVMTGEVASVSLETAAFSSVDRAMLYRVVITVQVQVAEKQSGKVVWKSTETLSQEYPAGTDLALQRNARDAALSSLCGKMAQVLVNRMNQAF